ncbi:MAG: hypothetical protein P4L67_02875 [Candidatus Pacebacteria bacterium]|nr:hypothetical protein [Candidatus Paceibacterota bacterium]
MEKTKKSYQKHSTALKQKARLLRQKGKTHREIAKELGISLGSAWSWTRNIVLSFEQTKEIFKRRNVHRMTIAERKIIAQRLRPFQFTSKYDAAKLIRKIQSFYSEHGRIPLKREFNMSSFFGVFGSWNNAITASGFDPNPILFSKKYIAADGHPCDSLSEKIIDDSLRKENISHERNWHYPGTRMTADFFVVPNLVIEFFGLAGIQPAYDSRIIKKKEICKVCGFTLLALYPENLFKDLIPILRSIKKPHARTTDIRPAR